MSQSIISQPPTLNKPAHAGFTTEARMAVLALLVAQYRAAGAQKSENVLRFIAERITRLGGETPAVCVRAKALEATKDLVAAAINVVRYLEAFRFRVTGLDGWYVQAVQSALSDAYKLASSDKILGFDLTNFEALNVLPDSADKSSAWAKAKVGMVISVHQYIDLLVNVVPLAYTQNSVCGLWLNDKRQPGKPLPKLLDDIDRMAALSKHLLQADRLVFSKAIDMARLAFTTRAQFPLNRDDNLVIETSNVYEAMSTMLKFVNDEDVIEQTHKAFTNGTV